MSYAAAVSSNTPLSPEQQPHPDASLLETGEHPSLGQAVSPNLEAQTDKVQVVDEKAAAELRAAMETSEPSQADHFDNLKLNQAKARAFAQAQGAAQLANEIKSDSLSSAKTSAKEASTKEEAKSKAASVEATLKKEAKVLGSYAEEEADKAKREADKLAGKASEKAKKMEKKGEKLAKDAAREIKSHPFATSGVVGLANLALIGATGFVAYSHWNDRHWDRRVVAGIATAWAALGGLQVWGGYELYEKK